VVSWRTQFSVSKFTVSTLSILSVMFNGKLESRKVLDTSSAVEVVRNR